jgi:hypothetical protein
MSIAMVSSLSMLSFSAYAAEPGPQPIVKNLAEQKFGPVPGYPDCMQAAGLLTRA